MWDDMLAQIQQYNARNQGNNALAAVAGGFAPMAPAQAADAATPPAPVPAVPANPAAPAFTPATVTNAPIPKFTAAEMSRWPIGMFNASSYGTGATPIQPANPTSQDKADLQTLADRQMQATAGGEAAAIARQFNAAQSDEDTKRYVADRAYQAHVDAEKLRANAHKDPAAIRASVLPGLLQQYGHNPTLFRSMLKQFNDSMKFATDPSTGPVPAGGLPNGTPSAMPAAVPPAQRQGTMPPIVMAPEPEVVKQPGAGPLAGAPGGMPGGPVLDEASMNLVENARRNALPAIANPGQRPLDNATLKDTNDFRSTEDFLDRLNSMKMGSNPAAEKQIAAEIAAGMYGDPSKVKQMLAQSAAANYMLTPGNMIAGMSRKNASKIPSTYIVPGYRGKDNAFSLGIGPSKGLGSAIGGAANQIWSGGIPYNQITLPGGEVIPFNPSDAQGMWGATAGDLDYRQQQAVPRAIAAISLLERLGNPNLE